MQQEGFYSNPASLKRPSLLVLAAISLLLALPAAPKKAVLPNSTIARFFQVHNAHNRLPRWTQHAALLLYGTINNAQWKLFSHQNTLPAPADNSQQALHTLWLQTAQPIRAGPPYLYYLHTPTHKDR